MPILMASSSSSPACLLSACPDSLVQWQRLLLQVEEVDEEVAGEQLSLLFLGQLAGVGLPRGEREGAQIISLADLERAGDERTFRRTAEGRVGSHGRAQARFKLNRTLT